ncbi:MAG TPA: nodulation protein NfeD [Vicinamibacterales bacterium]|nr:nodulation protein NfeD [Vicinamibacterales bacterium]
MPRRTTAGLLVWIAFSAGIVPAQSPPDPSNPIIVVEYDGIIHPIAAEFFDEVITRADTTGARLVILNLRTPGGLLDSTRTMVSRMIASRTPVVVFVGPSGARAASAGFILTLAADVAAMAPGTHIGAAHPVSASGQENPDQTMSDKAASDTAAYARTLAEARRRNVALAAEAVLESRAFTDQEALNASPPLIDLVARDIDDLLAKLDGRRVTRFDGREITLDTKGATIERMEMSRRQQLLSAIAHPQIAYLLMSLGMLGLIVELWNPGAIFPGVVGGICLLLAFFAFQVLPVNVAGILLIVLGIGLLVLEATVPSFGVLGIGGIVSLVAGAVLVTSEVPGVSVNYQFIVPVAIATGGVALFLGRLAMQAQAQKAVTGAEGLIGRQGHALSALGPQQFGQVSVHGEIWRAQSASPIAEGTRVRVTALDGLTLTVEREQSA